MAHMYLYSLYLSTSHCPRCSSGRHDPEQVVVPWYPLDVDKMGLTARFLKNTSQGIRTRSSDMDLSDHVWSNKSHFKCVIWGEPPFSRAASFGVFPVGSTGGYPTLPNIFRLCWHHRACCQWHSRLVVVLFEQGSIVGVETMLNMLAVD